MELIRDFEAGRIRKVDNGMIPEPKMSDDELARLSEPLRQLLGALGFPPHNPRPS